MSLQFVSPFALGLLVMLAVPWLLRRRQPTERRHVGNLYLWQDVRVTAAAAMTRHRRPVDVLVLLQMAAIATTVLAFARPVLLLPASRITLVFDISASMGAQEGDATRLTAARTAARTLVARVPPASQVRVIAAAASPRTLGEYAAGNPSLQQMLDRIAPTAGDADLRAAVAMARAADAASAIIVFSDREPPAAAVPDDSSRPIRWERVGRAADNVAVSLVAARRTTLGADGGDVLVEASNFGALPVHARIELSTDSQSLLVRTVSLPARGSGATSIAVSHLGRMVSARLLDSDALAADDVRYARVPASDRLSVVLVGRRGSFIERALSANPLVSLRIADDTANAAAIAGADVVVCDGCATAPAAARSTLLMSSPETTAVPRLLTVADPDHPVAAELEVIGQEAVAADVRPAAGHVVLRAGNRPVVTAIDDDAHRVVEWRIDVTRGGFALSPTFPVILANAIQWLSRLDEERNEVRAGEPLRVGFRRGALGGNPAVTGPDGRVRDAIWIGGDVVVADTGIAGPYTVRVSDRERIGIVNPSVDTESDLSMPAVSARAGAIGALPSSTEPLSLAPWCAVLAASLVALEWRYRTRRRA